LKLISHELGGFAKLCISRILTKELHECQARRRKSRSASGGTTTIIGNLDVVTGDTLNIHLSAGLIDEPLGCRRRHGIRIDLWRHRLREVRGAYFNGELGPTVMLAKGFKSIQHLSHFPAEFCR
jgi:hypothetical protein